MGAEPAAVSGCLICGAPLVYAQEHSARTCAICGAQASSNAACEAGHYVCDSCHSGSANDLIQRVCAVSSSAAPLEIASMIMRSPLVKMHGPEHHFLVPAVLLCAYCNAKGLPAEEKDRMIRIARRRAEDVKGGFCGFLGSCGAGMGTGMFVSIVTGATPVSRSEWGLANLMTSESLRVIAEHGGPRCCKRDSFFAILSAVSFLRSRLGVDLDATPAPVCGWSDKNKECLREECVFYSASAGS
ncbi:MAG TPA: DUF5714 domain-containing protein [Spirochaetia bacterium]|nr:DUF5714 domain-containing protein [Spirochaetia bacterium]